MHFLSLSLGALVFLAVLYSPTAQLLQFRNKNLKKKKKKEKERKKIRSSGLCNSQDSAESPSLNLFSLLLPPPPPPFLAFSDSNLHVTNQNSIQAFDKR